jgi:hypothetical protein
LRTYAGHFPRPKPGTAERPPYRAPDPLKNNPHATVTQLDDDGLTFIHRPPPSAPSPHSLTSAPTSPFLQRHEHVSSDGPLPPFVRPSANKPVTKWLSDEDIAKMRMLRKQNPHKYTRGVLAEMFGCTEHFVGLKAALNKNKRKVLKAKVEKEHMKSREKWSERHQIVMAIRAKRKEFW